MANKNRNRNRNRKNNTNNQSKKANTSLEEIDTQVILKDKYLIPKKDAKTWIDELEKNSHCRNFKEDTLKAFGSNLIAISIIQFINEVFDQGKEINISADYAVFLFLLTLAGMFLLWLGHSTQNDLCSESKNTSERVKESIKKIIYP